MRFSLSAAIGLFAAAIPVMAQDRPAALESAAWFGVMLPPGASTAPAVRVGARAPRPVSPTPEAKASPELSGAAIKADVETIVNFAKAARAGKEVGSGQMWGRIAGFPSSDKTVEWALGEFARPASPTCGRSRSRRTPSRHSGCRCRGA